MNVPQLREGFPQLLLPFLSTAQGSGGLAVGAGAGGGGCGGEDIENQVSYRLMKTGCHDPKKGIILSQVCLANEL